jgi:hypothetical protein
MSDAVVRLDESRARLRESMLGRRARRDASGASAGTAADAVATSWLALLHEVPIVGSVVQSLQAAWRDSPLPAAADLAESAGNEALRPTAERHPLALVGVAMAGGALFVWARPWRTLWRAALAAGLVSQLSARVVAQIPIASLFDAIQGLAARRELDEDPPEGRRHSG